MKSRRKPVLQSGHRDTILARHRYELLHLRFRDIAIIKKDASFVGVAGARQRLPRSAAVTKYDKWRSSIEVVLFKPRLLRARPADRARGPRHRIRQLTGRISNGLVATMAGVETDAIAIGVLHREIMMAI